MRRLALGCALLLAMGTLAGCSHGKLGKGEGRLTTTGEAYVARPGKALRPAGKSRVLHARDRVVIKTGDGQVQLAGGGAFELRSPVTFTFDARPFLQTGEMLVEPASRPLSVETDNATVTVPTGATRLSRTLALTVTSYRGRATVSSPGSAPLTVRAPRRATVAGRGVLPSRADGFDCHSADVWDRRFLADSCFLGDQLQDASEGFAGQLPAGEGHTAGFFRQLYPQLEQVAELTGVLDTNLPPSENLVGAAIALDGTQGTFADRWRAIFAFRDPGDPATHANINWGMVAIDQGIDSVARITQTVDTAISRAPKLFSPGTVQAAPPALAGTGSAPSTASGPGAVAVTTTTTTQPRRTPSTTGAPSVPKTTSTTVSVVPTVPSPTTLFPPATTAPTTPPTVPAPSTGTPVDKVVDPLVDLVNNLLTPPAGGSTVTTTTTITVPLLNK